MAQYLLLSLIHVLPKSHPVSNSSGLIMAQYICRYLPLSLIHVLASGSSLLFQRRQWTKCNSQGILFKTPASQFPGIFRTESTSSKRRKRMAVGKTWISEMPARFRQKKSLNTIKPVNSLYILDSENSTYQYFPALLNGLKENPPEPLNSWDMDHINMASGGQVVIWWVGRIK